MSKLGNVAKKTFLEVLEAYNGAKTMQRLDLSNYGNSGDSFITAFECYKLAEKLKESGNGIVALCLNNNRFKQGGIEILLDALTHDNCQIKSLHLNGSNLNYGLENLINALPQSTLQYLSINNNGIGNSGANLIADAIGNNDLSLKEISLNGNGIEVESALMLKEAIQQLPTGHLKISFINNPVPHSFSLYTPLTENEIYSLRQFKEEYSKVKPDELRDSTKFMYDQKLDGNLPEDVQLVDGLTPSQKEILNLATLQSLYVSSEEDGSSQGVEKYDNQGTPQVTGNKKKYSEDYSTISLASILNANTSNFQKGLEEYYNKVTPQMVINAEKKQSNTTQVQPMGQQQVWYEQYCTALYEQCLDEIG